jgi:hypothetical protein
LIIKYFIKYNYQRLGLLITVLSISIFLIPLFLWSLIEGRFSYGYGIGSAVTIEMDKDCAILKGYNEKILSDWWSLKVLYYAWTNST